MFELAVYILRYLRCVPLRWSGLGLVIPDHGDHCGSNEPMNPLWTRIHRFIWSTMIRIIPKERTLWLSQVSESFCGCFFHAKPKSDREFRIRINDPSDPWRLLVCILLSFIVCLEGWCVGWVESVSARVLYENGHSQESLVPLISTSFPWCPVVVATSTPSRIGHMLFSRGFALYLFIKLCEQMHVKSE